MYYRLNHMKTDTLIYYFIITKWFESSFNRYICIRWSSENTLARKMFTLKFKINNNRRNENFESCMSLNTRHWWAITVSSANKMKKVSVYIFAGSFVYFIITFEIHYQTSNTSDLLDRFEQRATQSKLEQFNWKTRNFIYTRKLYSKDVSAGYNQNELLFAYKDLMENPNGSNSMNSGDADGRRNVTNAENTKRPSFGNEICKWIHRNNNNSQAIAFHNRIA